MQLLCFYTKYSYMKTIDCVCSAAGTGVHDEGHDESASVSMSTRTTLSNHSIPIKTQDFGENEDENHADEDPRLAHERAHTLLQSVAGPMQYL